MENKKQQLEALLAEGKNFTFSNFCFPNEYGPEFGGQDKPEWLAWKTRSFNLVKEISAENSPASQLVATGIKISTKGDYSAEFERAKGNFLKALEMVLEAANADTYGELKVSSSKAKSSNFSNKVFIVHGHDQLLKSDFERFIHEIGLEPIVLHRQPDEGMTIIEKFEKNADVGFAFILLTPDEIAYTVDQEKIPDQDRKKEMRARPNVIFEFGYFAGRLGRNRVCCIYTENVELPSDISGLVYKKITGSIDTIAFSVIKELKAAGYKIQV